jgi:ElaB/YqjD/DUF883 family membrane-anchored ribosome-binding protein
MTQSIEAQLTQIRSDLATLAKSVADRGREKSDDYAHEIGRTAERYWDQAGVRTRHAIDELGSGLRSVETDLVDRIRANPLATLGLIGGAALLLGWLARK